MDDHEQAGAPLEFTASALASRELTDYGMPERLRWLCGYDKARFVPTSRDEANDAFWAIYNAAKRGQTAAEGAERIRTSSRMRAKTTETLARADNSVAAVAQRQAAYIRQASREGRWLKTTHAQVLGDKDRHRLYPNAAAYFSGTPLYEGSGQLVRYMDTQVMIDQGRDRDEFALRAQLDDSGNHVVDAYTAAQPAHPTSLHVVHVLESVSMDGLADRLGEASANEDRRLAFWTGQLVEVQQHQTTQLIARTAIEDVNQ